MGIFVNSFQLVESGVGVDLGGIQTLVTQQLSYAFDSCIMIEHGCGKRVAQHVRRAFLQHTDLREILPDRHIDGRSGDP